MGCCQIPSSNKILLEQELRIAPVESFHPFASKEVHELFAEFGSLKPALTLSQFYAGCAHLNLSPKLFIESEYSQYVQLLQRSADKLDWRHLMVSSALLSKSTWEEKLRHLLELYSHLGCVRRDQLIQLIEDLAYSCANLFPRMAPIPTQVTVEYLRTIHEIRPFFITNVLKLIEAPFPATTQQVCEAFKASPALKELLSPSGLRRFLLEEDSEKPNKTIADNLRSMESLNCKILTEASSPQVAITPNMLRINH